VELLFSSDRTFKVWRYSVSHRVLLLRSTRDDRNPTRIDVIFGQVTRMLLVPVYSDLNIFKADHDERKVIAARIGGNFESNDLFVIGSDANSLVASGPPSWHEDERSYSDPSFFESMLLL
jgi:hypothetical protein